MAKKKTTLRDTLTATYGDNPAAWPQWTHTAWTCPECEHENDPRDDDGDIEVSGSVVCAECAAERPIPV